MRSIFPCARHDRFVHSLGTYHLGSKIFESIRDHSDLSEITEDQWKCIKISYELACLLHDCGHAPFSHTFEDCYAIPSPKALRGLLGSISSDNEFSADLEIKELRIKSHEIVSAILLLEKFNDKLSALGANTILSARMIVGCLYSTPDTPLKHLSNCFIKLLNGHNIDADRLDYIKRDKWASGYNSTNLDLDRLLASLCIKYDQGEYKICFHRNAISEIQNVINAREFQSSWIFSHHKVHYDQHILVKAVECLANHLNPGLDDDPTRQKELAMGKLFNINSFLNPDYSVNDNVKLYLPSDDDIVHLLKNDLHQNAYAEEWFSRQHKLKPLWKSYADYNSLFYELDESVQYLIQESINSVVMGRLELLGLAKDKCQKKDVENKAFNIFPDDIFIYINKQMISYDKLVPKKVYAEENLFMYIYVPQNLIDIKSEMIIDIKSLIHTTYPLSQLHLSNL